MLLRSQRRPPGPATWLEPTAFDRMVKECLRIGLPISGVRVPF